MFTLYFYQQTSTHFLSVDIRWICYMCIQTVVSRLRKKQIHILFISILVTLEKFESSSFFTFSHSKREIFFSNPTLNNKNRNSILPDLSFSLVIMRHKLPGWSESLQWHRANTNHVDKCHLKNQLLLQVIFTNLIFWKAANILPRL